MEWHEAASIFPMLEQDKLDELAADIAEHGLREPIVLCGGKILDGRNRFRACGIAKVKPHFEEYSGDDPIGYVVSLNLHRRHLTPSQLSIVGVNIKRVKAVDAQRRQHQGRPPARQEVSENFREDTGKASDQAAEMLGITGRLIEHAENVVEYGVPELVDAVRAGTASVSAAAKVAKNYEPLMQLHGVQLVHEIVDTYDSEDGSWIAGCSVAESGSTN